MSSGLGSEARRAVTSRRHPFANIRTGWIPQRMRCLVVFVGVSSRSARSTGGAMSLHRVLLVCTLSLLAMTAAVAQATGTSLSNGSKEVYLLTADRVFDARSEQAHPGWAVLVEGDTIAEIGPRAQIHAPANAQTINLPGTTLMPGLIDAHSHIFLHPYNETLWNDQVLHEPLPYRTIEAVRHVRATLLAGFTALRDLGTEGAGSADVDVQRAIDEGLIPGPHLFVATRATVARDCYGPGPLGFRRDLPLPQGGIPVAGV